MVRASSPVRRREICAQVINASSCAVRYGEVRVSRPGIQNSNGEAPASQSEAGAYRDSSPQGTLLGTGTQRDLAGGPETCVEIVNNTRDAAQRIESQCSRPSHAARVREVNTGLVYQVLGSGVGPLLSPHRWHPRVLAPRAARARRPSTPRSIMVADLHRDLPRLRSVAIPLLGPIPDSATAWAGEVCRGIRNERGVDPAQLEASR